ncbi:alcohol dehydrogenase [Listeria grandensis]|uniref:alcohol dehydrogenase n=1 Tax=Listeria grandensis TaxID=1494963 RepID=UPI00164DD6C1|nr:alcohol dehydrogenase [Listeria grandensis]MBC6316444.1 alcohol dehydrogenase catalytic domain-containing protein [Listeria grandensis]
MKVAQLNGPNQEYTIVEREIPNPKRNQVRIKVEACGVCHSDSMLRQLPENMYPAVPGHEVVGRVDAIGEGVTGWSVGQKVGVGWHGGHCFHCESCRRGDFSNCEEVQTCGISYDGGFAEFMVAPDDAVVAIPEELNSAEAAPLLCAGITTFNALRNNIVRAGSLVAIQGVGGLGHLAIQYANKLGYEVIALARGEERAELAHELGAHHYFDTTKEGWQESVNALGGVTVALATAPNAQAISALTTILAPNGKVVDVAVPAEPVEIQAGVMIGGGKSFQGWYSGTPVDGEDTTKFSKLQGIKPMIETYPLEKINEAYEKMMAGKTRFRAVIVFSE